MGIRFTYEGGTFEAATPKEAAELFRLLRNGHAAAPPQKQVQRPVAAIRPKRSQVDRVVKVLGMIENGGPQGVKSQALVSELGFGDQRGLGPLANLLRNRLSKKGLTPNHVFLVVTKQDGRYWVAQQDIRKAIEEMKK